MQRNRCIFSFILSLGVAGTLPVYAQQIIDTVTAGSNPAAVAINPVTNKIYVANLGNKSVTVIDGLTDATTSVAVGNAPTHLAVDATKNKVYVSNAVDDTVTVIDGASLLTSTVNVGLLPFAIAVNPVTDQVYVGNQNSNDVTVIDGATLSTTAVPVGQDPLAIAVNPVTNKTYVANYYGNSVTVIDGATNNTITVIGVISPRSIAVNPITNKIYLPNFLASSVTVIDGSTFAVTSVPAGSRPLEVAVDAVTNKIYVTNELSNSVTVIDGTTNVPTTIAVGNAPQGLDVDVVTNKIYVANSASNSITMIDGVTNATTNLSVGNFPSPVAVNPVSNRAYVGNTTDGTVSVVAGAASNPLQFVAVTPCRVVDTRNPNGPFGGPSIPAGTSRSFALPSGSCAIPTTAAAYSLNVTVVPHGTLGYLTIWPTGEDQPLVSTMNSADGRTKANAAIVPAGANEAVSVFATNTTDVVLDINGYFEPLGDPNALAFYPLTPCRVADTRNANGPLGGPALQGGQPRDFPVLNSTCNIPAVANAYSMNFTVVPSGSLSFLTVWPSGQSRPLASTLNDVNGTTIANAAIVQAGTSGNISAYATQDTNLVIDINGYFASPGAGGLSLYPTAPCRALDTRQGNGDFVGELTVPLLGVQGNPCGLSPTAESFVFNATVLPKNILSFLTLWPDGESRPLASTLNAIDGSVTSNMAVVPSVNGSIDAYATDLTQLVMDISSYFAP